MKERPILFRTPMVQAILDGRKTMTRRVVKDKLLQKNKEEYLEDFLFVTLPKCPHGEVGDLLWVRETWHPKRHNFPIGLPYEYKATALEDGNPIDEKWKPSIFMPKEACRIFLRITNVRVERLQDISEKDAVSEGIEENNNDLFKKGWKDYLDTKFNIPFCNPINSFNSLWDSINGENSWNDNPWVWVITFERIK